jgi:hypothetical protein
MPESLPHAEGFERGAEFELLGDLETRNGNDDLFLIAEGVDPLVEVRGGKRFFERGQSVRGVGKQHDHGKLVAQVRKLDDLEVWATEVLTAFGLVHEIGFHRLC